MATSLPPKAIAAYTNDLWEHVCPRVRLLAPASAAGIEVIRASRPSEGDLQVDLEAIARADLVFILRDFPRAAEAYSAVMKEARRLGKPVVYELDDLLFDLPPAHPDVAFYRAVRYRLIHAAVEADALIVTTENLRRALSVYNPRIFTVPNYLDDSLWQHAREDPERPSPDRDPLVIGYQGGRGHIPDLEPITLALVDVLRRYGPRVKFKFWGAPPPEPLRAWPNVEWLDPGLTDYASFAAYFQSQTCDIFLAPVIENAFNTCKSPLKYLEYSILNTAGIYSRCAPYDRMIIDGQNGLLAASPQDWEGCLVRLIEDASLRRKLGRAARETVQRDWLLGDHAGVFRGAVEQILALPLPEKTGPAIHTLLAQSDRWQEELEKALRDQAQVISEQKSRMDLVETDLRNIKNGIGWNLLQKAHRAAQRLAPAETARARWLGEGMDRVRRLRNRESVRARMKLRRGESLIIYEQDDLRPVIYQPGPPELPAAPGGPLVSLLLVHAGQAPAIQPSQAAEWVQAQTCQDVEIIAWDRDASGPADVLAKIRGKYVGVVSADLVRQCPTYLETNLLALESEKLAFTVNTLTGARTASDFSWFRERITAGSLPGDDQTPLLRAIVRRDCLDGDLEIDLSPALTDRGGASAIVGRIVAHASEFPDHKLSFPFNHQLKGGGLHLLGTNMAAYPFAREIPIGAIRQSIYRPIPLAAPAVPVERPTVLMVMPFLAMGGAERIAINMMRRLAEDIRFVTLTLEPHDAALGSTAEEFRQISPYVYCFPDFLSAPLYDAGFDYLFQRFNPQTLYIANGATWIYNALPHLKQRHPRVRVVNQVYDHAAGWINRYDPQLVRLIDGHIGSNYDIDRAYVQKGVRKDQVFHIENGIDTHWYAPEAYDASRLNALRDELHLPRERKIITFIARLHTQKRPLDFIEMARRCAQDTDLFFLMVGDGPLSEAVNQEIRRCELTNLARLPFYTPSRDIYAVSDVMVLPSEYEGMPMVVLEAQSMGKPFVATRVGNIHEVLEKTGGGLAVSSPGDINGLISSIRQVLDQPVDSTAVREAIRENYSLEKLAYEYSRALLD